MQELQKQIEKLLSDGGIESYRFEAKQLINTFLSSQKKADIDNIIALAKRRAAGEPLQYLLGEWDFWGISLKCDRRALIPRADTEILVEVALEYIKSTNPKRIIDICSGTGCIAIALATETKRNITALEKYETAYSLLCENIKHTNADVTPVLADLCDGTNETYDLIVSNPPYINTDDIDTLQKEVGYEPKAALDGGSDGLYFYKKLCELWVPQLSSGGMLAVEIGINQHNDVKSLFENAGLKNIKFTKDYSGIIRTVCGIK